MNKFTADRFERIVCNASNSDLKSMLGRINHELDLSERCILAGEEKKG